MLRFRWGRRRCVVLQLRAGACSLLAEDRVRHNLVVLHILGTALPCMASVAEKGLENPSA